MREIEENYVPFTRKWAPVRAGLALLSAVLLVVSYWNLAGLTVLHDHPLPTLIFWPAFWVSLAMAVTMVIPSDLRSGAAIAWAFGGTGFVVFLAGCVVFAVSILGDSPPSRHGHPVDSLSSADGRYRVEVFAWQAMLGEPGWDVVIYRRDGLRISEAYAGCLYSEASAYYEKIQSVDAGSVRIVTDEGLISIAFDHDTMQITTRIPEELCAAGSID